jgi:signal transduction histidine kinase
MPSLLILAAVIAASSYGGLGPGLFATVGGGLATDYFLVPPIHRVLGSPEDAARFAVFVVIGVLTSLRSAEIRRGITLRERLLRDADEARAAAEAANQAKDQFLAMLSHELRSPLAAIRMWSSLLRSGKLDADKTKQALEAVEDSVIVQARLVADLLDVSRIVSGKLTLEHATVDLATAAQKALHASHAAAKEKHIRLEESIEAGVGFVRGDAARLRQVVSNLVSNAIKFTPEGGRVAVHLERVGNHTRLTVSDTGEGIAPDLLPHIFERFRQGDGSITRRSGGLGLGLAIARHIVAAHGGTIEARSPGKGAGATFLVTLPLCTDAGEPVRAVQTASAERPSVLDGVAVLVVEDDRHARDAIATVLERSGAQVRAVGSAAAAMIALKQDPADVLLTDIAMPNDDGYGLLEQLRDCGVDIPAAVLTGLAAEQDRHRALAAGFDAYLAKPVNPALLVDTVATLANVPV